MNKILVSACLLGQSSRYDGCTARFQDAMLDRWQQEGRIVAICPEVAGGLGIPRPTAEIVEGDGHTVLAGKARVVNRDKRDVTLAFVQGAREALALSQAEKIEIALLKGNSPSCGNTEIYDGTFSGRITNGAGVTAAALIQHGIHVFNEKEIAQAAALLARLNCTPNRSNNDI
jgi:uncharacterized protein YbbK (DUF523 family)